MDISSEELAAIEARIATAETTAVSKEEIIEAMRVDLNVFASIALPDEFNKPFSAVHLLYWQLLTESVSRSNSPLDPSIFDRFALGLPRGHAKTTMLKLLCLWIILFTERRFILIVCSTFEKASAFLDDVVLLMETPNIEELFGTWNADADKDNEKIKNFNFQGRRMILQPVGVGGSIRGKSRAFRRPDVIICDDIQEKEDAENPQQAEKMLVWFLSTLLKARNLQVCTAIYLGNMYKDLVIDGTDTEGSTPQYCCLLRNLQLNSEWKSIIVGAILADGTALWEEVVSKESLLSDLRQDKAMGREEIFMAESMNDPRVRMTKWYDPSKVPPLPYTDFDVPVGKALVIDPSLGKKKSDKQIVGLFYIYDETGPVFQEAREFQVSSPDLVKEVLLWALVERVPLIASEAVAYQGTLLQWFAFFAQVIDLEGINFVGVTPKGFSKAVRILAYFKSLMAGTSKLTQSTKAQVDYQASFYVPTKTDNVDDVLDVGAYGEQVFLEYSSDMLLPLEEVFKEPNNAIEDYRQRLQQHANTMTLVDARIPSMQ